MPSARPVRGIPQHTASDRLPRARAVDVLAAFIALGFLRAIVGGCERHFRGGRGSSVDFGCDQPQRSACCCPDGLCGIGSTVTLGHAPGLGSNTMPPISGRCHSFLLRHFGIGRQAMGYRAPRAKLQARAVCVALQCRITGHAHAGSRPFAHLFPLVRGPVRRGLRRHHRAVGVTRRRARHATDVRVPCARTLASPK